MRVLILGATGRVGSLALVCALAADHTVVALVRDPGALKAEPGLTVLGGDISDASAVGGAMRGVDAVIAALGPRGNTIENERALEAGMRAVVAAMDEAGVRRLVALSGAGIDVPGDRKPWLDRVASRVVRRMARHVVGAKQREYDVFSAADIDWTALRPPLVTDGPPQGYRLDLRLKPGARVRRADVPAQRCRWFCFRPFGVEGLAVCSVQATVRMVRRGCSSPNDWGESGNVSGSEMI